MSTALKLAVKLAVVTTSLFAFGDLIGNSQIALFGAFGSIALLSFVEFGGPPGTKLRAYVVLAAAGFVMVTLGTLASHDAWIAGGSMAAIAFVVLFAGILNGYIAAGANAALLAFVISVMIEAPASQIPDRLAGWALASVFAIGAAMLVWPSRPHGEVRDDLAAGLRAVAAMVTALRERGSDRLAEADEVATGALAKLRRTFTSEPYRPTGATGPTAALSRLVADVNWLRPLVRSLPAARSAGGEFAAEADRLEDATAEILRASASTLERGAERPDVEGIERLRDETGETFAAEVSASIVDGDDEALAAKLEEAFRLRILTYGAGQIGIDTLLAAGEPAPEPDAPTVAAAAHGGGRRAWSLASGRLLLSGHMSTESVWFRNSLRGAIGLGLAVLIGELAELQHGFWVVLGTLSVLRSNALATGSTILRALAGTAIGILVGGALVALLGSDETLLWVLLPFGFLLAGYAPRAISFAAGQAAFTTVILILFDLITPIGWSTGLVRIEDIAIGCGISLGVGLLFWPRGAAAVVRQNIATAYERCAEYVSVTIGVTLDGGDPELVEDAAREALSARLRLDDALHQYLGEQSAARLRLDSLGLLSAGATRLRRVGDQLRSNHALFRLIPIADPSPALADSRRALEAEVRASKAWFGELANSVLDGTSPPEPAERSSGRSRILDWVRDPSARSDPGQLPPGLAIAWAGEMLDALRALEPPLAEAAEALTKSVDPVG